MSTEEKATSEIYVTASRGYLKMIHKPVSITSEEADMISAKAELSDCCGSLYNLTLEDYSDKDYQNDLKLLSVVSEVLREYSAIIKSVPEEDRKKCFEEMANTYRKCVKTFVEFGIVDENANVQRFAKQNVANATNKIYTNILPAVSESYAKTIINCRERGLCNPVCM